MFYSKFYFDSSIIAGNIIKECNITTYPINPIKLARKSGIKIVTYASFSDFTRIPIEQIACASSDGFSVLINGQYFIAYNPHVTPKERRRWTLIHEYCHIKLGHVKQRSNNLPDYLDDIPMESEANELTCCLIAPLPVALMCNISSEKQFSNCFGISDQASKNLYADYNEYRLKDIPVELGYGNALDNFRSFILDHNRLAYLSHIYRYHGSPNVYYDEPMSG